MVSELECPKCKSIHALDTDSTLEELDGIDDFEPTTIFQCLECGQNFVWLKENIEFICIDEDSDMDLEGDNNEGREMMSSWISQVIDYLKENKVTPKQKEKILLHLLERAQTFL